MDKVKLNIPINKVWSTISADLEWYDAYRTIAECVLDDADKKWWISVHVTYRIPLIVEVSLETKFAILASKSCVSEDLLTETLKQFLKIAETLNKKETHNESK